VNTFIRDRENWQQHAKDRLNRCPLGHLLIDLVVGLLHETLFTKKKWARAVDMHHGLNLGDIEVIRKMEVMKKNEYVDHCSISRIVEIRNCCFLLDYFKEVR
jgi:hypothetical protein